MSISSDRAYRLARVRLADGSRLFAPGDLRQPSCVLRYAQLSRPIASQKLQPRSHRSYSTGAAAAHTRQQQQDGSQQARFASQLDPLRSIAKEMNVLTGNIQQLLGSGHPILDTVAKYYTMSEGKHFRPMLVLLMSRATANAPKQKRNLYSSEASINAPLSSPEVLADANPSFAGSTMYDILAAPISRQAAAESEEGVLPSQSRLAEITELIHTASLLHDDVLDQSTTRRSQPSANIAFGNKMAVLAGDFLLGRASVALARLRDPEVTELLATVIANLVEGEFMQLQNMPNPSQKSTAGVQAPVYTDAVMDYYLQKTYLKSASLISKSCRAAALLGASSSEVVEAAYAYGKNLGLAFQLVDDMLDYMSSDTELGKPAGADLELGLATAPLLFAWRSHPELGQLVARNFAESNDAALARDIVKRSDGIECTRQLAQEYADRARLALRVLPATEAKTGLEGMCRRVMERKK